MATKQLTNWLGNMSSHSSVHVLALAAAATAASRSMMASRVLLAVLPLAVSAGNTNLSQLICQFTLPKFVVSVKVFFKYIYKYRYKIKAF
jgi:hypothetical protein